MSTHYSSYYSFFLNRLPDADAVRGMLAETLAVRGRRRAVGPGLTANGSFIETEGGDFGWSLEIDISGRGRRQGVPVPSLHGPRPSPSVRTAISSQ
jgi:hypothetical protein